MNEQEIRFILAQSLGLNNIRLEDRGPYGLPPRLFYSDGSPNERIWNPHRKDDQWVRCMIHAARLQISVPRPANVESLTDDEIKAFALFAIAHGIKNRS